MSAQPVPISSDKEDLPKKTSRMFEFITKTWNPVKFCSHGCSYCWARDIGQDPEPILYAKRLEQWFDERDFVFVCDMGDLFCQDVPDSIILPILDKIGCQGARFLLMTKNPARYNTLWGDLTKDNDDLPNNALIGCTIESNRNYPAISKAPPQGARIDEMKWIKYAGRMPFISVEPILDFDLSPFVDELIEIHPWAVAIGYDNHHNNVPEPPLEKTLALIRGLEAARIKVYRKTLRKAWDEK